MCELPCININIIKRVYKELMKRKFLILLCLICVIAISHTSAFAGNTDTMTDKDNSGASGNVFTYSTGNMIIDGTGSLDAMGAPIGYDTVGDLAAADTILDTDITLLPPAYTTPCPESIMISGECPMVFFGDATHPQTNGFAYYIPGIGWVWLTYPDNTMAEILDDIYQRVADDYSSVTETHLLDQYLDKLFYMKDTSPFAPNGTTGVTGDLYFDETLIQDVADYVDDPLIRLEGTRQKLVNLYSFDQSQNPVEFIDQWVLSNTYDRDYVTDVGPIEEYSSWFGKNTSSTCPNFSGEGPCTYTYSGGHEPVNKSVSPLTGHNNPNP